MPEAADALQILMGVSRRVIRTLGPHAGVVAVLAALLSFACWEPLQLSLHVPIATLQAGAASQVHGAGTTGSGLVDADGEDAGACGAGTGAVTVPGFTVFLWGMYRSSSCTTGSQA